MGQWDSVLVIFVSVAFCYNAEGAGESEPRGDLDNMVNPSLIYTYPLTISGFSSGGNIAQQMQVAFSRCFNGSAAFAGVPYHCGVNGYTSYRIKCNFGLRTVKQFVQDARRFELEGKIDPLSNLEDQLHYHYVPNQDTLVLGNAQTRANTGVFFRDVGMNPANIKIVYRDSEHFMPSCRPMEYKCTDHIKFKIQIVALGRNTTGVADCGYDGAYEALRFLFQRTRPLIRPADYVPLAPLRPFDQSKFLDYGNTDKMDPVGYLYIPTKCVNGAICNFHVALHGCRGSRSAVGTGFITRSGYLEVAEVNNIVMIFPQSIPFQGNSAGCWDVFEATGPNAATKFGVQMQALMGMIRTVTGLRDCN